MASHQSQHPQHTTEEHHPGPMQYIRIAVILTLITSVEVAVYYIPALESALVYILLALSAVKFVLVVGYYMHLKFDNKLFRNIFVFGLIVGMGVVTSLMVLFERLGNG